MRKIPATMVTQHPDHASTPYWHSEEFISVQQETEECYRSYAELGATEYKWDWEGKFVDESVAERLLSQNYEYFKKYPLGKDKFLTFRLPNPKVETEYRLGRAFMGIISAAGLAKQVGLYSPPLFEVILPMTETADEMIAIEEAFSEMTSLKHPLLKHDVENIRHIEIIPLFEDIHTIMKSDSILDKYLTKHEKLFKFRPKYMRPYVARSDPALNAGIVPTVLAIKIALSRYKQFEKKHRIKLYPVIGCAALPFRGGLTPENIEEFTHEYRGIRTTTIQSAFRYDYPHRKVTEGIKQLETLLPKGNANIIASHDQVNLVQIAHLFESFYRDTIEHIAPIINDVATHLPKRRERVQHIGLFGYSRGIGKVKLPRAIGFTAALYSIGIPPELIGTGRGLKHIMNTKSKELLETHYVNLKQNLLSSGRYVNKLNLERLSRTSKYWDNVKDDINAVENYIGEEFRPKTSDEKEHIELSRRIFNALQSGKSPKEFITQAAVLRRSLG